MERERTDLTFDTAEADRVVELYRMRGGRLTEWQVEGLRQLFGWKNPDGSASNQLHRLADKWPAR